MTKAFSSVTAAERMRHAVAYPGERGHEYSARIVADKGLARCGSLRGRRSELAVDLAETVDIVGRRENLIWLHSYIFSTASQRCSIHELRRCALQLSPEC